ncbi:LysR family transcriptional regulator [Vibrio sp. qd031]|uniref:LysR family transcriptional regulator n=1 Tax=Vibrio sp. qd031 TaxID=1603038 RepID=UPI000A107E7E|nr:LysR family transcriptional regulator [Vibrio sp. qd031]ORT51010.1 LysR family transcriptional regulator [Vibrio sp. qd031]
MKNTELNLIPIFVAIYEESSLSKAALRLNISQPAVSKALARLRELYGEPLFHRTPTGVTPTNFSIDIYPALLASLNNFNSTLNSTAEFDPKKSQKVFSIACISLISFTLIPILLRNIYREAPQVTIEVHPLFTEDYESDLRLQRYDLVIDRTPADHSHLHHKVISRENLVVLCSRNHPRIGEQITFEQLMEEQHVVSSVWHSRKATLSEDDYPELSRRNVRCSAAGFVEMLAVVEGSEYVCLSSHTMHGLFGEHYNLKKVSSPADTFTLDVAMIWHPSRTNETAHRWLRREIERASANRLLTDIGPN